MLLAGNCKPEDCKMSPEDLEAWVKLLTKGVENQDAGEE